MSRKEQMENMLSTEIAWVGPWSLYGRCWQRPYVRKDDTNYHVRYTYKPMGG